MRIGEVWSNQRRKVEICLKGMLGRWNGQLFFSFLICSFLDASCGKHFFVIHLSSLNDFEWIEFLVGVLLLVYGQFWVAFPKDIIMFLDAHVRPAEGWSWIDNLAIELTFHVIQSSFFGPIFRLASTAFEAYQPELQAYLASINHFYGQLRELPDLGLRCCGAVDSYLGFEHLGNGSQCRGGEDDVILASLYVVGLVQTCVGWLLLI